MHYEYKRIILSKGVQSQGHKNTVSIVPQRLTVSPGLLLCSPACHSEPLWYDLHGAFSAGLEASGHLLDEHAARGPEGPRPQRSDPGALPLAAASHAQGAAETLQGE